MRTLAADVEAKRRTFDEVKELNESEQGRGKRAKFPNAKDGSESEVYDRTATVFMKG